MGEGVKCIEGWEEGSSALREGVKCIERWEEGPSALRDGRRGQVH